MLNSKDEAYSLMIKEKRIVVNLTKVFFQGKK
jgi:hypothetical protein